MEGAPEGGIGFPRGSAITGGDAGERSLGGASPALRPVLHSHGPNVVRGVPYGV